MSACCAGLLAIACYWTVALSWAGRERAQFTDITEDADDQEAMRALEAAASSNPTDWAAWIRLGVRAEAQGDFARAEDCYGRAAAANRRFQPSWTLANYYFRRENREQFNVWVARALRMSYGDARPVFDLCWRSDPNPELVLRAVADRRDVLRQYLAYLIAMERWTEAGAAAARLLPQSRPEDVPTLLSYCGRLVETGDAARAMEIWNELSRQRRIPHGMLAPERGQVLTNGNFEEPPSSFGFDWRIIPWDGVSVDRIPGPGSLRVTFTGAQPESCEIVTQYVPVLPGRSYRLRYESRTPGMPAGAGLRWRVYTVPQTADLAQDPPELSSGEWGAQELRFTTGSDCRMVRLALVYQRAPGTARAEGALWLRHLTLD